MLSSHEKRDKYLRFANESSKVFHFCPKCPKVSWWSTHRNQIKPFSYFAPSVKKMWHSCMTAPFAYSKACTSPPRPNQTSNFPHRNQYSFYFLSRCTPHRCRAPSPQKNIYQFMPNWKSHRKRNIKCHFLAILQKTWDRNRGPYYDRGHSRARREKLNRSLPTILRRNIAIFRSKILHCRSSGHAQRCERGVVQFTYYYNHWIHVKKSGFLCNKNESISFICKTLQFFTIFYVLLMHLAMVGRPILVLWVTPIHHR